MARSVSSLARAAVSSAGGDSHAVARRALGGAGNMVAFAALVGLAARIEFPIDSVPTIAMVLLGVLSLAAGLLACCSAGKGGSSGGRVCRGTALAFIILQLSAVILESLLTLLLFARMGRAVQLVCASGSATAAATAAAAAGAGDAALADAVAAAEAGRVRSALNAARWVLLCLLLPLQASALSLGVATRCCGYGEGDAADGGGGGATPADHAGAMSSLGKLRGDVERGGGGGGGLSAAALGVGAVYDKTRSALVAKYGKALAKSMFR